MKKRLRNIVAMAIAIAFCAVFGTVAPASADAPGPTISSAKFVRSVTNCNVGTLKFIGLPSGAKNAVAVMAWHYGGKTAKHYVGIQFEGPGGNGPNWKHTFGAGKNKLTLPKGQFKIDVSLSIHEKNMVSTVFSTSLIVPPCK